LPIHGKPRTTDLRPWLWGAALEGGRDIHPRAYARGVLLDGVKESSLVLAFYKISRIRKGVIKKGGRAREAVGRVQLAE